MGKCRSHRSLQVCWHTIMEAFYAILNCMHISTKLSKPLPVAFGQTHKYSSVVVYPTSLTCTLQICRSSTLSFGGRMASAFSLVKSRSLYLVIGPMWQKFILLTIPHYSKINWPMTLFRPRSSPFMSSNDVFLQAKSSKIKRKGGGMEKRQNDVV